MPSTSEIKDLEQIALSACQEQWNDPRSELFLPLHHRRWGWFLFSVKTSKYYSLKEFETKYKYTPILPPASELEPRGRCRLVLLGAIKNNPHQNGRGANTS